MQRTGKKTTTQPNRTKHTQGSLIGTPTPRLEGPEKVSGKAIYASDVSLPGMLWCKLVRSPIAYGRIKQIDVSRALSLSGVGAVITGKDVSGLLIGRKIYDMPILADGVVRFVGEKVAAVAAENEEIAEEAARLIEVDYEELSALLDPLEARESSAPLLHPNVQRYRGLLRPIERPSNVFFEMKWTKGEIDEGFRDADIIVENTFTTRPVHQAYIEPHACVVQARSGAGADIWACSKVPFALREQVATAFGQSVENFLVHPCYIGGCFGGKGDFMDVPVCYVLSLKTGLPVKMVMDYGEEFVAGNPRHAAIIRVKSGVTHGGRLVAHRMDALFDSGAYAAFKPQGYLVGPKEAAGPYNIPNVVVTETIVYTNKVPCGHMRAPGDPQVFFANESQMELIARQLNMDSIAFRKKNLMRDGDISPIGHVVPHIKSHEILDEAVRASGYEKPKGPQCGRGVAVAHWLPLGGECHAFVTIDAEGNVTVSTAMLDQGAGTHTAMRIVAAEELKLPLEKIRISTLDTSEVGPDTGIGASRGTRIFGGATRLAAIEAREQLLEAASRKFETPRKRIEVRGEGIIQTVAGQSVSYAELAAFAGGEIRGHGFYRNFESGPEAALCVQVAEVDVDPETGQINLLQFTSAHSTGTVLNPLMHQGQIDGGVVMGMGYSLMEGMRVEDGHITATNFGDNKIPSMGDIPPLKTVIQEFSVGNGPYGAMSIGEPPLVPTAAAIANAVHDAVGVRIKDLPITAEKVLKALKALNAER